MIKSISYWAMPGGLENTCPPESAMDQAKAAGYKGIELAIGPTGEVTLTLDQKTCEKYRDAASQKGLVLETLAAGFAWGMPATHPDAGKRKESIEAHKSALQRAAWLGCKTMLFVPGAVKILWEPSYGPVPYKQAVAWAKEAIRQLADQAEKVGVEVGVENVWNGLFYSPLEFAQVIDDIGSSKVGVYFDVGNVLGYHQHPPDWIEILGKRIKRVHVKDFKHTFGWQGNYDFCDLLKGDVPWKETMAALKKIGYDKTLVAEMIPPNPGILERTSKAMDQILAM
jgi:hexulose-6-phosphate isomerase